MEKFARGFFSVRMMAMGMLVFLLAIAFATFLETKFDTQTAKVVVYHATWFELLLVYLSINLIANIFRYRMFRAEKISVLMFHLSFLVMLIGAGVTRYASFEGLMIIPEGGSSNFIYSSDPYFWFKANDGKMQYTWDKKAFMTEISDSYNYFDHEFKLPNSAPVTIEYVEYRKNYIDSLVTDKKFKETTLEIVTERMQSNFVTQGSFLMIGDVALSFDKKDAMPGIQITMDGAKVMMETKFPITFLAMSKVQESARTGGVADSLYEQIPIDTLVQLATETLYRVGEQQFVLKSVRKHARMMKVQASQKNMGSDYLTVKIIDGKDSKEVELKGGISAIPTRSVFEFKGKVYEMEYGSKVIELPFSIYCRDFQLDRYPGSNSPTSFASEITIMKGKKKIKDKRIEMNKFMDYGGYRFFQSGYEPDESGTHLSVNHDWWGTNISYLGYLMMGIGMLLSLFSPVGRFRELFRMIQKSSETKKKLMQVVVALILSTSIGIGQEVEAEANPAALDTIEHSDHTGHDHDDHAGHDHATQNDTTPEVEQPSSMDKTFNVMSVEHSEELASLLVHDIKGRVIPMHTLCDQLLRKLHRDKTYKEYNAVQTIISMHIYWDYWMDEKMIYISSKGGIRDELGIDGSQASFNDLLTDEGYFKFVDAYNKAHQTMESKRGEFDKQVLKLGEKFQILTSIYSMRWDQIRILPVRGDASKRWTPISDENGNIEGFNIAIEYFRALNTAYGDAAAYKVASEKLVNLKEYQRKYGGDDLPSEFKVDMEIMYNNLNIFSTAYWFYLAFGFCLLIIFFFQVFTRPTSQVQKVLRNASRILGACVIAVLIFHGAGIVMRMMITGYAPWSTGYEALVFISWVAVLVGLIFSRINMVIPAAGALLAFFLLFVADMGLLDPEITPMVPVLKSFWLKIHVAIITGSYAPLGIAFVLGFINLVLYVFRSKEEGKIVGTFISILTYVTEMTMMIGLFMLAIGTFLGGVWANESWGRYWGWDPKETWALVAVLVYAIILHLRYIPAVKDKFTFNVLAFWGFASILFTFFGVNFYLVGLHSYANGEGLGEFPEWLKWMVAILYVFTEVASLRNQLYIKNGNIMMSYFKKKLALLLGFVFFSAFMLLILDVTEPAALAKPLFMIVGLIVIVNVIQFVIAKPGQDPSKKPIASPEIDQV